LNGAKSAAASSAQVGQRQVAVGARAAVAGDVLDHRGHAALGEALAPGEAERRHRVRPARERAVADDVVAARLRHVEHRRAIDVDGERRQLVRDETRVEPAGGDRRLGIALVEVAEHGGGRRMAPMRRPQARDASALLVDEHRCVRYARGFAQIGDQRLHLRRRFAIAPEQDEPGRPHLAEKRALFTKQRRPRAAEDGGGERARALLGSGHAISHA
jgi:hypothetical protein